MMPNVLRSQHDALVSNMEQLNDAMMRIAEFEKQVKHWKEEARRYWQDSDYYWEIKKRLEAENARLKIKLESVYEAGLSGISYVGAANYASREREAKQRLHKAMREADDEN